MGTAHHERTLHGMRVAAEETVAATHAAGGREVFAVDATRVARGSAGGLYRIDPPPTVRLVEDATVRLSAGGRVAGGRLGPVADESCLVETDVDLGPRVLGGRLVVDNVAPARALRDRLDALSGPAPDPPTYRFDQAALVLGAPGGRLRDRIAAAAEATGGWSLDDRAGDLLHTALRYRWASVQSPPGADAGGLVARLLARLLELEARVLFVAPGGRAVDRTVGALCERLAGSGRLRSGLVQRVGPLSPGSIRDRYGPYLDADVIAADLRARLATRLTELDRLEGRLRYDEAEQRATELERHAAEVDEKLGRTVGSRLGRRGGDPDALVVRLHELRAQRRSARQTAHRIALELAGSGHVPHFEEVFGEGGRTPAERLRQLASVREELTAARDRVEAELRGRCRLVATTTRSAYQRALPRADFDVVVLAGPASVPEAYYLAGLSTRSVIGVGDGGPGSATPSAPAGRADPARPPGREHPGGGPHPDSWLRRWRPAD